MKVGKRLTAFFLAGMLILTSNVTGFAEETTADQQPEEAKSTYLLTVDAEDSTVTVKGDHVEQKTASTYQIEAGSEVVASVAPADEKEIKEVRVNEEQMDKTTPRLIQFHTFKNAANPPFLGGFSIFSIVAA